MSQYPGPDRNGVPAAPDDDPAVLEFLSADWRRLNGREGLALRIYDHEVKAERDASGLMRISVASLEHGGEIACAFTDADHAAETARAFVSAIFNTIDEMLMRQPPPPRPE